MSKRQHRSQPKRRHRRQKDDPGLRAAIANAGGVMKLSRLIGITHVAISNWTRVPPYRVPAVSRVTGVPRHKLRPDLYEPPERVA